MKTLLRLLVFSAFLALAAPAFAQESIVLHDEFISNQTSTDIGVVISPNTLVTLWVQIIGASQWIDVQGGGMTWVQEADASASASRGFRVFSGISAAPDGSTITVSWPALKGPIIVALLEHPGRASVTSIATSNWRSVGHSGPPAFVSLPGTLAPGDVFVAGVSVGKKSMQVDSTSGCANVYVNENYFATKIDECAILPSASWSWNATTGHWMAIGLLIPLADPCAALREENAALRAQIQALRGG